MLLTQTKSSPCYKVPLPSSPHVIPRLINRLGPGNNNYNKAHPVINYGLFSMHLFLCHDLAQMLYQIQVQCKNDVDKEDIRVIIMYALRSKQPNIK